MSCIRKIFLLINIFLVTSGMVNGQWRIERSPVSNDLNAIAMLSYDSGWIAGDNGTLIYKSKKDWINYPGITNKDLFAICLTDQSNGWAVGASGTILRFNGVKWNKYESPTREDLYSVSFRDPSHGIAVGARGTILIFENNTWRESKTGIYGTLYTVNDRQDISITGGGLEFFNMPILKIEENSQSILNVIFKPGYDIIKSMSAPNRNNIWAVGLSGSFFHFNGNAWISIKPFERMPSLNSIFFVGENKGLAVGYGGIILTYSDKSWMMENSPVTVKLNGSTIFGNSYYAVGDDGTIISLVCNSEYSPSSGAVNMATIKIDAFPNPSSSNLSIKIPDNGNYPTETLTVTNSLGKVSFMKKITLLPGDVFEIPTSELKNGFYFVVIRFTNGKIGTGKFVVNH